MIERTEVLKELQREIDVRKENYPKLIATGEISRDEAERRLLCMQAALYTIRGGTLFSELEALKT